ncbi:MAG: SUMF1/EgtB/PvdO family nonheme iron enzyme [Rhodomicrobium sp.]
MASARAFIGFVILIFCNHSGAAARAETAQPGLRQFEEASCFHGVQQAGKSLCIRPGPEEFFKDCPDCPEMVAAPVGAFLMGRPESEVPALASASDMHFEDQEIFAKWETPQRKVTIPAPFEVGRTLVTQRQFEAFASATNYRPSHRCSEREGKEFRELAGVSWQEPPFGWRGDNPAVCLNWYDAEAYVQWLSKITGERYRLLTESEAEYAARAGAWTDARPRIFLGNSAKDRCLYANSSGAAASPSYENWLVRNEACWGQIAPAMSFGPNAWGLYDVRGDIWTWTEDCWSPSYSDIPLDGSANKTGDCGRHSLHGGSWLSLRHGRTAFRDAGRAEFSTVAFGLRVARSLTALPPAR